MDLDQFRKLRLENDIHNDAGTWDGAPATALTGVDMVNTSGAPVTVYVFANGATITAIKVGGVTTGLTAGTFRVRHGEALNIAYSVATPTLKWYKS